MKPHGVLLESNVITKERNSLCCHASRQFRLRGLQASNRGHLYDGFYQTMIRRVRGRCMGLIAYRIAISGSVDEPRVPFSTQNISCWWQPGADLPRFFRPRCTSGPPDIQVRTSSTGTELPAADSQDHTCCPKLGHEKSFLETFQDVSYSPKRSEKSILGRVLTVIISTTHKTMNARTITKIARPVCQRAASVSISIRAGQ